MQKKSKTNRSNLTIEYIDSCWRENRFGNFKNFGVYTHLDYKTYKTTVSKFFIVIYVLLINYPIKFRDL